PKLMPMCTSVPACAGPTLTDAASSPIPTIKRIIFHLLARARVPAADAHHLPDSSRPRAMSPAREVNVLTSHGTPLRPSTAGWDRGGGAIAHRFSTSGSVRLVSWSVWDSAAYARPDARRGLLPLVSVAVSARQGGSEGRATLNGPRSGM